MENIKQNLSQMFYVTIAVFMLFISSMLSAQEIKNNNIAGIQDISTYDSDGKELKMYNELQEAVGNYKETRQFDSELSQAEIPDSIVAKVAKHVFNSQNEFQLFFRAGLANITAVPALNWKNLPRFTKRVKIVDGMLVLEYTPKYTPNITQTIIYVHGGGLVLEMQASQLNAIADIAYQTEQQLVVPIYPIVQYRGGTAENVQYLMNKTFDLYESQGNVISLVGDSAGGNIVMALATYRDNNGMTVPENVVALFPWLNLKLDNPVSKTIEPEDSILSISGLKIAGELYAADMEITDPLVSPLYADYSNNYNLMLTASEKDILTPDIDNLRQKLTTQGITFSYEFYKDSYHDFILFNTPETDHLINKVVEFLR